MALLTQLAYGADPLGRTESQRWLSNGKLPRLLLVGFASALHEDLPVPGENEGEPMSHPYSTRLAQYDKTNNVTFGNLTYFNSTDKKHLMARQLTKVQLLTWPETDIDWCLMDVV